MEPSYELITQLYREEVLRARKMSIEDKFFAGMRLFELACLFTTAGIREDCPYADNQQVQEILKDSARFGTPLGAIAVNLEDAVLAVLAALNRLTVPYMLVGSFSSNSLRHSSCHARCRLRGPSRGRRCPPHRRATRSAVSFGTANHL